MISAFVACAPLVQTINPDNRQARLDAQSVITADGFILPVRKWAAEGTPDAIVIALHGFNDYSNAFAFPGSWWRQKGITTIAYDQRGFGETEQRGIWPGSDRLIKDLALLIRQVRDQNRGIPIYLLGESMGGSVVMAALASKEFPAVDGAILSAPAVWGSQSLNIFYKIVLWMAAHTFPATTVTVNGLDVQASDNISMLRNLGRDPLFIKETRIDTVYGVVDIMDRADDAAVDISVPLLMLYGARDEIIPKTSVEAVAARLGHNTTFVLYEDGWHLLLRDLQAKTVWQDILFWIKQRKIPSGSTIKALPFFKLES